eukprot:Tamp_22451.p1 GENE.Tamp_22451~~Tamp_22451.p1  ORF type:complete len:220 (+),score=51.95 Tamp_22451:55-660(+)
MRLQAVAADPAVLLAAAVAAGTTFEAQAPPIGTSLAVLGSTGGVLAYWWLVLVPSERRDLAKNKNKGGLNEYLDDLETSDPSERKLEKWFYTEWLARRQRVKGIAAANAAKRAAAAAALVGGEGTSSTGVAVKEREGVTVEDLASAEREVEQQELARELSVEREREIDRAVPMPSFFSLDNPVVIALSLALLGAAFGGLGR